MRVFAIYNPTNRKRRVSAWILYEPANDSYKLDVSESASESDLPLMLELALKRDEGEVAPYLVKRWVQTRVVSPRRSNIDDVLAANKLDEYYIPSLLVKSQGRSSQDDFLIIEVDEANYRDTSLETVLDSPVQFGTLVSRARRAADLTQGELAERCGIQQAVISRIEAGKANPTLETMELLAKGCNRSLRIELE